MTPRVRDQDDVPARGSGDDGGGGYHAGGSRRSASAGTRWYPATSPPAARAAGPRRRLTAARPLRASLACRSRHDAQMDQPLTLRELTDANRDEVLTLRLAPGQDRFVSSVAESIEEAAGYPQASPWYRAVYAGDEPVGFVMLSWDCVPQPPEIIGPWFLWKLIIDERHQRHGYGHEVVRLVADLVRAEGGDGAASPAMSPAAKADQGRSSRLGFVTHRRGRPRGRDHPPPRPTRRTAVSGERPYAPYRSPRGSGASVM